MQKENLAGHPFYFPLHHICKKGELHTLKGLRLSKDDHLSIYSADSYCIPTVWWPCFSYLGYVSKHNRQQSLTLLELTFWWEKEKRHINRSLMWSIGSECPGDRGASKRAVGKGRYYIKEGSWGRFLGKVTFN